MADISKININGSEYNVKDTVARNLAGGGVHYIGITKTTLIDDSTKTELEPASTGSMTKTSGFVTGDLVLYQKREFIYTGSVWKELGPSDFGDLAYLDEATGSFTPSGSVSINGLNTLTLSVSDSALSQTDRGFLMTSKDFSDVTFNSVTNVGSTPTLGPAISYTPVTSRSVVIDYETGTVVTNATVSGETLTITIDPDAVRTCTKGDSVITGTAISIPNVTSVGSVPTISSKKASIALGPDETECSFLTGTPSATFTGNTGVVTVS